MLCVDTCTDGDTARQCSLCCDCYCKYTTLKRVCQEAKVNILIFLLWGSHRVTESRSHRGVTRVTRVTDVTRVTRVTDVNVGFYGLLCLDMIVAIAF